MYKRQVLICAALLVGTSFAWFTDSVSNSGNKIKAGTLMIDAYCYDLEEGKTDFKIDEVNGGKPVSYTHLLDKVYKEAVELCVYLCKQSNLDPKADGVIIDHSEGHERGIASNHSDVGNWWPKFGKSMDAFRADVAAGLDVYKRQLQCCGKMG